MIIICYNLKPFSRSYLNWSTRFVAPIVYNVFDGLLSFHAVTIRLIVFLMLLTTLFHVMGNEHELRTFFAGIFAGAFFIFHKNLNIIAKRPLNLYKYISE